MTPEFVMTQLLRTLEHGRVEVPSFVATFGSHDIEAGQVLSRLFHMGLLRGRFVSRLVDFDGHISAIADNGLSSGARSA